ncbi:1135_t:CDS:2 [Ambispora leptoticha]|uniref:1135_t:CDS:1 n=1 Tax=Ambispora leptoticha TaxID=144679 RepID=A0A9N8VUS9_9GLOM|nr:1135_t:CDS:2 [Ambispora leptoticha]
MKFVYHRLLFSLVICIYLTLVISFPLSEDAKSNISNSTSSPCEEYFKVGNCSSCQKTAYRTKDDNIATCWGLYNITLISNDASLLTSKCNLPCNQTALLTLNADIQRDCKQELINWVKNSTNVDTLSYLWKDVYSVIPYRQSICTKSSDGTYCAIGVRTQITEYLSSLSAPDAQVAFEHDLDGSVSYGDPEKTVALPKNIRCSDCYIAMAQPWIDFAEKNPSPIPELQSELQKYIEPIKGNTTQCAK